MGTIQIVGDILCARPYHNGFVTTPPGIKAELQVGFDMHNKNFMNIDWLSNKDDNNKVRQYKYAKQDQDRGYTFYSGNKGFYKDLSCQFADKNNNFNDVSRGSMFNNVENNPTFRLCIPPQKEVINDQTHKMVRVISVDIKTDTNSIKRHNIIVHVTPESFKPDTAVDVVEYTTRITRKKGECEVIYKDTRQ